MRMIRAHRPLPALAFALLAVACAPPGGPAAPATPTSAATATPAPVATATPSAAPTVSTDGALVQPGKGSPSPATSTPAAGGVVEGVVYDLEDRVMAGVAVTLRSLDASAPATATATTDADGRYRLTGAPRGVDVEVTARKAGWTPRRRVVGVGDAPRACDFGGAAEGAQGHFLSPYPEITDTTPLADGKLADPRRLSYVLTLSEPLDAANRTRFEQALRVLPADTKAGGGRGATALATLEDRYPLERMAEGLAPYAIAAGTAFRNDFRGRAIVSWDAEGRVATFTFDAPLVRSREDVRYQVVLAAGREAIRDAEGLPLGTGPTGGLGSWPAVGGLVLGAFRDPDGKLTPVAGLASRDARWAATHDNYAAFVVAEDDVPPRLVEARVENVGADTVFKLRFDEPLAAYDGSDAGLRGTGVGDRAADLAKLTFAIGKRGEAERVVLDGTIDSTELSVDPRARATFGAEGDRLREFRFDATAFVAAASGAATGSVLLDVDAQDPTVLNLRLIGRANWLEREAEALKARVEGPSDPAGNRRDEALANTNMVDLILR